jgi:hypothetical protein
MTNRTLPETPVGGPLGDTGDGDTGVPEFEQGISNRPGDRGDNAGAAAEGAEVDDQADLGDQSVNLDEDDESAADDGSRS